MAAKAGLNSIGGGADDLQRAHSKQRRSREQQAPAARARTLAAEVSAMVARDGAARLSGLPPGVLADGNQRRRERLGALRLREATRLPVGDLPRRADAGPANRLRSVQ